MAWKHSHMGCSALLCGRFDDSQESRFQASKRSNVCSVVLESVRCVNIHEFYFQAAKRSDMVCVEQQRGLFADCHELHFQVSKRADICITILHECWFQGAKR